MFWFLLWLVVALAGFAALALVVQRLWQQGKALAIELGAAAERLERASQELNSLSQPPPRGR